MQNTVWILKCDSGWGLRKFLYLISSVSGTLVYGSMALTRRLSSTGWKENESYSNTTRDHDTYYHYDHQHWKINKTQSCLWMHNLRYSNEYEEHMDDL